MAQRVPDLFGLPWELPKPERLRYYERDGPAREGRGSPEFLMVVRVPTVRPYADQVQRISRFVWSRLPQAWRDNSKLRLRFSFHPQNPALNYNTEENAMVLEYNKNVRRPG